MESSETGTLSTTHIDFSNYHIQGELLIVGTHRVLKTIRREQFIEQKLQFIVQKFFVVNNTVFASTNSIG